MLASEAITLLKSSELKQLGLKVDTPTVLGFINLGILEIHKRFNLWESEAIITMADSVFLYKLDGIDANVAIDLSDHSLMMIEEVYDVAGNKVVLNDENDPESVLTPQYHQIEVVLPIVGETLSVIYRASPKFLTAETQEIPLSLQFTEALFNYVAFKGHGSIKSTGDGKDNSHYLHFLASCKLIKTEGLIAQDDLQSTKFKDRGFV